MKEAHRAGIRVLMITGDHPLTAAGSAADLGTGRRRAGGDRAARPSASTTQQSARQWPRPSAFARVTPSNTSCGSSDALAGRRQRGRHDR
ncbi:MAG: hypothetical protein MZU95_09360 [Desulfomicrobium escambiense]|nr:hypothetical protein [Desulfomicrobium escambiense]